MKILSIPKSDFDITQAEKMDYACNPEHIIKSKVTLKETQTGPKTLQENILMKTVEMLENNKHLDDSHPLDKDDALPIESFSEAAIELNLLKTRFLKDEATKAQANILPQDVISLFLSEDIFNEIL